MSDSDKFIPALKYSFLTPVFDPVLRWTLRDLTFKRALIDQANLQDDHLVLDVGCGTGTLLLEVSPKVSNGTCTGLDGDPKILSLAQSKAKVQNGSILFDHAMSYEMPYEDASFDRVFSSLFFHHLTRDNKLRTLREIRRVLKPDGELHIADWGRASNLLMRLAFYQVQILDGFETTADNVQGDLPDIIKEAGFEHAVEVSCFQTIFGTLSLYKANL